MHADPPPSSYPDSEPTGDDVRPGVPWYKLLNRYHWFVFVVCCLAWDMDCMDQQLFVLARRPAMSDLVAPVQPDDPRLPKFTQALMERAEKEGKPAPTNEEAAAALRNADIQEAGGFATSIFMLGWAVGGIGFGVMGDRVGRVKTLMLTILLYAVFTGLSALSASTTDFHLYRFLTGLGVGGVFAASVTLLAETVPDRARPMTLGLFQASSAVGNCGAALVSMWFGSLQEKGSFTNVYLLGHEMTAWRLMFVLGIVPGLLVVFIQLWLKEPERWKQMVKAGGKRGGSYAELLGEPRWRRNALLGLMLALAGVIGLWGIGFFSPDLQQYVAEPAYKEEAVKLGLVSREQVDHNQLPPDAAKYVNGQKAYWAGITSLLVNVGAFFGIFAFSWVSGYVGRKWAFAAFFLLAGVSTAVVFLFLNTWSDIFWMVPLLGFFQLALFGGRLRSTGTSFCYNVGRLVSAVGPTLLGLLTGVVFATYPAPLPLRYAGVTMCSVFLLGLLALPFLPETRGRPLPE